MVTKLKLHFTTDLLYKSPKTRTIQRISQSTLMPSSLIFLLLLTAHNASPLNWTYRSRCYDHQTDTYHANDMFSLKTCSQSCTVTPFFSPDNALEAHMKLIDEAQESITIANPSKS